MSIWTYGETCSRRSQPDRSDHFTLRTNCSYCASPMVVLAGTALAGVVSKGANAQQAGLLGCPTCGWWSALSVLAAAPYQTYDGGFCEVRQLSGVLRNLDITDLSVPSEELSAYLLARYGDRFAVHPRKYEEIVAGVFSNFGYKVRVTSFSGDEGIDIFIFDGDNNATVGVQVKRYKGKISAEQIRSFVGALLLQGLTYGIYVTTGAYERGAYRTGAVAAERLGIGVTLLDAKRFYEALQITTRTTHWSPDDPSAPYYKCWHDISEFLTSFRSGGELTSAWPGEADFVWGSGW